MGWSTKHLICWSDWASRVGRTTRSTIAYVFEYRMVLLPVPGKAENSRAGGYMLIDERTFFTTSDDYGPGCWES